MTPHDPLSPLAELPGVAEAVDATRAAMDGLLREPALRRRRGEVRAAARVHSAWASARLAGSDVVMDQFDPPFADDESGRLAAAALHAASEVGSLAATWKRAPLQALARLHTVAAAALVEEEALGRPRAAAGVSERLATLADVVASTAVPGVIVSAVVHGELLAIEPFGSVDDIVARAASRVVLVESGVDPDAITVPEVGLIDLGADAYASALQGFVGGRPTDVGHWITFHAAAVQRGAAFARTLCR
ncbi:MAG TPA: oxidoreductase [Actinomycetes bacterium]|nr:oxidoreductase [Actinomycetes bacterium]